MGEPTHVGRIRTLIVDDEPGARKTLRNLLVLDSDIDVVGECFGEDTPAAIRELGPDLVFLDVQMPKLDGFQILASLEPTEIPLVIFTTAYDEYALDAFDHAAVDYLLKPFSDRRFFRALARAKEILRQEETELAQRRLVALLSDRLSRASAEAPLAGSSTATASGPGRDRLVIHDSGRLLVVLTKDIVWIEAQGPYVRIHAADGESLVRESLGNLEAHLDPARFFRIHRSAVVNLERVREVKPLSHGDCTVVLRNGTELKLSRTRREEFETRLVTGEGGPRTGDTA